MKKGIKIDVDSILSSALLVFFPLCIVGLVGGFLIPHLIPFIKEIIAFGSLSLIFFCLHFLIKNRILRKFFLLFTTLLLSFLAFIKLSFYYHYGVKISASALFVIFETNGTEASDFLSNYLDLNVFILFLILLITPIVFLNFTFLLKSRPRLSRRTLFIGLSNTMVRAGLILLIIIASLIIFKKLQTQNIILTSFASYQEYVQAKLNLRSQLSQNKNDNITITAYSEDPQTHVVIIGESTSSWHMQLYGYSRETNPLLSEIKDELFVYSNVISPHVHTILSLEKAFTLSNYDKKYDENNVSIVQLANAANYSTFWLSNQKPVGIHESIPTIIGTAADQQYFIATDNFSSYIYDEALLPSLQDILNKKDGKKIIFIHLIGTHSDYKKRYPDDYKYFNDQESPNKAANKKSTEIINQYDNAVRYNDYIIRQVIEKVRRQNSNSFVVYFSDHGDDVFDVENVAGHNEYQGTRPMFEIPFLLWMSESYRRYNPNVLNSEKNRDRAYNIEDLIHSFSDLSKIEFKGLDLSRSIFNNQFKERRRYIKNGIDYDQH